MGDLLLSFYQVFFAEIVRGVDDFLGEVAIIGEKDKPCSVAVEAANGKQSVF